MARVFNGSTDQIVVGTINDALANIILLWIRPTTLPASTDRDIAFTYREVGTPTTNDKNIYYRSTGIVRFRIFDGATKQVSSTSSMSVDTWYMIGCKTDGTNIHFYFNGVDEAQTLAGNSFNFANPDVWLGSGAGNTNLDDGETTRTGVAGDLAFVCVWDSATAISNNMIAAMYRGVHPLACGVGTNMLLLAPIGGNLSPEDDYARSDGNGTGTVTGTTKFAGNPPVELIENYL